MEKKVNSELNNILDKELLKRTLERDVLAETEKKHPGLPPVMLAGLSMQTFMEHNRFKRKLLSDMGDTNLINTIKEYIEKTTHWGFEEVYKESYMYEYDNNQIEGFLYVFARRDGLVLTFDTYGDNVNSAHLYFNIKTRNYPEGASGGIIRSGRESYKKGLPFIFVGNYDAREALGYHIELIQDKLLSKWEERPFLWIISHADTDSIRDLNIKEQHGAYESLMEHRIAKFPDWVKEMVGGK